MEDLPKAPKIAGCQLSQILEETAMLISRVTAVAVVSCVLLAPSRIRIPASRRDSCRSSYL